MAGPIDRNRRCPQHAEKRCGDGLRRKKSHSSPPGEMSAAEILFLLQIFLALDFAFGVTLFENLQRLRTPGIICVRIRRMPPPDERHDENDDRDGENQRHEAVERKTPPAPPWVR